MCVLLIGNAAVECGKPGQWKFWLEWRIQSWKRGKWMRLWFLFFLMGHRNQQSGSPHSLQGCVVPLLYRFRSPHGEEHGDGQTASRTPPYVQYNRYVYIRRSLSSVVLSNMWLSCSSIEKKCEGDLEAWWAHGRGYIDHIEHIFWRWGDVVFYQFGI